MGLMSKVLGIWVQELFKCKPAIMRAFQAAKGVHKVLNCWGCCAIEFPVSLCACERWCVGFDLQIRGLM